MSAVLVPLAQGCEELETVTITDILVRGGVEVVTASLDSQTLIQAGRGMQFVAATTLAKVEGRKFELIVLPGGLPGATHLENDPRLIKLLQTQVQQGRLVAAICAAPKVLAAAGLLVGKRVTGFPGVVDLLEVEAMEYCTQPVVEDGQVITSRGPGTAMDFALQLLERLQGKATRIQVEAGLQRELN